MRSHQQIIKDGGGPAAIAGAITTAELPVEPGTAKQWGRNDSIPNSYWAAFAKHNLATLDELAASAEAAAIRKRSSPEPTGAAA